MTAIDYEKEYDNRSRVPEHPEIFARWTREGAAYREARRGVATIGEKYGPGPRQTIDFFPAKAGASGPLALFIHGGWWRSLEPTQFSQCAKGPNAHGVDVAVIGYELCPTCSIANIIEQARAACLHLWRARQQRFLVYGHSAGGHLTACMVATDWKTLAPDALHDLVPSGYAISPVVDLLPLLYVSQNSDLRLKDEAEARAVSPLYWSVPAGRTIDSVVGALESSEFLRQAKVLAQAWKQGMAITRYEAIAAANHFTVIDPLMDPQSAMTRRVVELARAVRN
ncbi:MAG: alpha/beta hydrolase [Pseudolabrys sp.]|nr:alpha/beta hydrolase [Pseudolabrys sp.]MBV9261449.1 alpha/beta hydrolase [Pseudolabrys sp.]